MQQENIKSQLQQNWIDIYNCYRNSQKCSEIKKDNTNKSLCNKLKTRMYQARQEYSYQYNRFSGDTINNLDFEECQICNQRLCKNQFQSLCLCEHQYCKDCLKYYVIHKIKNQFSLIQCPKQECKKIINLDSQTYQNLSENLRQRYKKIQQNLKIIGGKSFRRCPQCEENQLSEIKNERDLFCTNCVKKFCRLCLNPAHKITIKCDNAVISILKKNYQFKRCTNCLFIVQRNEGCNHMTCLCGFEFCYLCGGNWNHGNHQCPPKRNYIRPISVNLKRREYPQRKTLKLAAQNLVFPLTNKQNNEKSIQVNQKRKIMKNHLGYLARNLRSLRNSQVSANESFPSINLIAFDNY